MYQQLAYRPDLLIEIVEDRNPPLYHGSSSVICRVKGAERLQITHVL